MTGISTDELHSLVSGSFVPTRLHMRLAGHEAEYPREGHVVIPNPEKEATAFHEHVHYLQTIMTVFGQCAWLTHRSVSAALVTGWASLTAATPHERRIPLGYAAKRGVAELANAFLLEKTAKEALTLGAARHQLARPNATMDSLGLQLVQKPWLANPSIELKGGEYHVQGIDVIEAHAAFLEAVYSALVNRVPFSKTLDPTVLPKRYWAIHLWFGNQVGGDGILAFPLVCDLALQGAWNDPPKTEEEWRATHPAWRFIALTKALSQLPNEQRPKSIDDLREKYLALADRLADTCGFERIIDSLRKQLMRFNSGGPKLEFERTFVRAMQYRLKHPWCGANPFLDLSGWTDIQKRFPVPLIEIEGVLRVTVGAPMRDRGADENPPPILLEAIAELHFQALAAQILGDHRDDKPCIRCGFAFYGIPNGCAFQRSGICNGLIDPKRKLPVPVEIAEDGNMTGCTFEMMMRASGTSTSRLDVDHSHRLPSIAELAKIEEKLRRDAP